MEVEKLRNSVIKEGLRSSSYVLNLVAMGIFGPKLQNIIDDGGDAQSIVCQRL